jgi:phospholipid-binding lipoprotein MlaA
MSLAALPLALILSAMQTGAAAGPAPVAAIEQPLTTITVDAPPVTTLPPCPAASAPLASPPLGTAPLGASDTPASPAQDDAIVVTARPDSEPGDPMLQLNAQSFQVVQDVDEALVGPVAMAYKDAIPKPIRHGLRNFLRNLTEPIVALNFLLQLKPGKAAETVGRFAVNSTIGIGGLFDVAKREPFKLPYRRNGFANTLGYYGVEPGGLSFPAADRPDHDPRSGRRDD